MLKIKTNKILKDARLKLQFPPQAAQAQNTRSYMVFFFLICERSAKRDMGHILLPNNRIGSRET